MGKYQGPQVEWQAQQVTDVTIFDAHLCFYLRKSKRKEKNASAWLKGWANPTPKGHEVQGGSGGNGAGGDE